MTVLFLPSIVSLGMSWENPHSSGFEQGRRLTLTSKKKERKKTSAITIATDWCTKTLVRFYVEKLSNHQIFNPLLNFNWICTL